MIVVVVLVIGDQMDKDVVDNEADIQQLLYRQKNSKMRWLAVVTAWQRGCGRG